jgi:hypothetical protein
MLMYQRNTAVLGGQHHLLQHPAKINRKKPTFQKSNILLENPIKNQGPRSTLLIKSIVVVVTMAKAVFEGIFLMASAESRRSMMTPHLLSALTLLPLLLILILMLMLMLMLPLLLLLVSMLIISIHHILYLLLRNHKLLLRMIRLK